MHKLLRPYLYLYFFFNLALRLSLYLRATEFTSFDLMQTLHIFGAGFYYDLLALPYFLSPLLFLYLLTSKKNLKSKYFSNLESLLRFLFIFLLCFNSVAEHLFWTEFNTRFNFIAVDYLVYTKEVLGNIKESYPLSLIFFGLFLVSTVVFKISLKIFDQNFSTKSDKFRELLILVVSLFALFILPFKPQSISNNLANEVSKNGPYSLFQAFWVNEIDFSQFYISLNDEQIVENARKIYGIENSAEDIKVNGLKRTINSDGNEIYKNVIIVVMESMSAEFMSSFGGNYNVTPNLDKLANEGIFFTNLYATGTRTVRGLEAITLSIPPTPGQSILRRPNSENLFNIGSVFKTKGYSTNFFYGGYGYFDNMNNFYSNNGFEVVDRTKVDSKDITFENVWGICDEDLFSEVIRSSDRMQSRNQKFLNIVMTTSNHRPYTYPENKIDIPSKSGRLGGVKYADYSIGKFIETSKTKSWFNDTIFVFIADHTSGAAGYIELDIKQHHIPAIIYAPKFVSPIRINKEASQIDIAPTIIGLLNFSYESKFFGNDIIHDSSYKPRSFVGNFQKVAMHENKIMTILQPLKSFSQQKTGSFAEVSDHDPNLLEKTTFFYTISSYWKQNLRHLSAHQ